ncbi:MAG TPA: acetyl-CoA hydrolase/transferase C-terminal domain-containing protein [Moraxellaceae bacterium]|nr:acetyl-CoA hydrolase/transferase C-terminal domain-containing protein [Moraxellaceae bacterium]
MARHFDHIDDCLDDLIARTGPHLTLGIPLGIGKPNPWVNALYRRVRNDPLLSLRIFTALSLEKPTAHSDMEARFLGPFVERVFGDYPDLDYVRDRHKGLLPKNIQVTEFFYKSGEYLHNDYAQQHYLSSNYTHVARDMMIQGVNVVAQAVAVRERGGKTEYSLSSNPDVSVDLIRLMRQAGRPIYSVLVVNRQMPFMENDALIDESEVDAIVSDPVSTHTIFSAPNMKIDETDYAIGLHVSSLVKDGGTLQIGIGSLGDAIAQALIVRDRNNAAYREALQALGASLENATPFTAGLYGCSEMFVNGFMALIDAGILRREVFPHTGLQRLLNAGTITTTVDDKTLPALRAAGLIHSPLTADDVTFLCEFGILKEGATRHGDHLAIGADRLGLDIDNPDTLAAINRQGRGDRLRRGIYMHGGFFLGPRDFYEKLRTMPDEKRRGIGMTTISYINQLYGQEDLAAAQRKDASFVNTCMMMTALGSAISDGLDNGQLVSGVGGQYNFVAQAHALHDSRSIMMLRATRRSRGELMSNIIWNYAHTTIPRHLRDIVVTEYGVADLRGQADNEVIKRLLAITDSRFQPGLLAEAKAAGKIEHDYEIPEGQLHNLPETVAARLAAIRGGGHLPDFPFGNDFTDEELAIIKVLQRMQAVADSPVQLVKSLVASLREEKEVPVALLERLHLDHPENLKQKLLRQLFIGNV